MPTEYAIDVFPYPEEYLDDYLRQKYSLGDRATVWWRLRSSGFTNFFSASVLDDGRVDVHGDNAVNGNEGIRPAMWI